MKLAHVLGFYSQNMPNINHCHHNNYGVFEKKKLQESKRGVLRTDDGVTPKFALLIEKHVDQVNPSLYQWS